MSSKVILQKVILFQILESQIQCLSCFQTPLLHCSYCKAFWEMKASATVSLTGQDSFWKLLQLWASPQPLVLLCLSLAGCVPACSLSSVRSCSQTCSNHIHLLSDTNQVWCLAVSDCGNRFRMWAAGGNQRSSCSAVLTLEVYGDRVTAGTRGQLEALEASPGSVVPPQFRNMMFRSTADSDLSLGEGEMFVVFLDVGGGEHTREGHKQTCIKGIPPLN